MSGTLNTTQHDYRCRPFEPDDMLLMSFRDIERTAWEGFDLVEVGKAKRGYPSRTVLANGEPLACYGIMTPWPTMGILWLFVSTVAWQHRFALWRILRTEWQQCLAFYPDLRRIETLTLEGDAPAERVARHLGFVPIARKRYYGPQGATYIEHEWVRDDHV